jgi:hypothetical protein
MTEEETWDDDPTWREYDPTEGTTKHKCWHRDGIVWLANDDDDFEDDDVHPYCQQHLYRMMLRCVRVLR